MKKKSDYFKEIEAAIKIYNIQKLYDFVSDMQFTWTNIYMSEVTGVWGTPKTVHFYKLKSRKIPYEKT